ncbi:class I SAM-dependent methyltransferase [Maritalea porphyrae]|uniref:Methyltransferase type 11 domain-containing protein n=1 Tax=Maritalea porphyrae TaxID=880732 RepID=A0ABQ5UMA9_9HYPH|nr:class I SAM-dependent methyltransferase [Maritalea porphyrae]GLQ16272.1 hypothetical protein GCM10007879_05210 [Maritalea porphyrae]
MRHGKIARYLVDQFSEVLAVDPSKRMIELGQSLQNGNAKNLRWLEGLAETTPLKGKFDLITAALSVHWMDHEKLFVRLAEHVSPNHLFAVIEGDDAYNPPWRTSEISFLEKWVPAVTGKQFVEGHREFMTRYQHHVHLIEEIEIISEPFTQSIDDFIACQHSRDTFAISKLGQRLEEFDNELKEILQPHADDNSILTFKTKSTLTLSKLKI